MTQRTKVPASPSGAARRSGCPPGPVDILADRAAAVDDLQPTGELARLRPDHVNRGRRFGGPDWTTDTAARLGLAHTLRPVGRPRKAGYQ